MTLEQPLDKRLFDSDYDDVATRLPKLAANPRAFCQATICHAVFGIFLGFPEDALDHRTA